jgi:glycosyltransferase involved in cell wall biosynthesis
MSGALVSVVIPVHNDAQFLGEAIEGVLAQTYAPVELIVVDDGSTDATPEVIDRYPTVRHLSQANAGPSAARNRGIDAAAGAFITFCDSDDRFRSTKVAAQVAYLDGHPELGCVLVGHETFYEPGVERAVWERDEGGTQPQSVLARREVFDTVGGFDPEFRFAEGIEWLGRVRAAGIGIGVLDEAHVDRRIHGANLSYSRDDMKSHLLLAMRRRIDAARETP